MEPHRRERRRNPLSVCPTCGSTVAYENDTSPGLTAAPLGAFAGSADFMPKFSVWERRRTPWTQILGDGVEHTD